MLQAPQVESSYYQQQQPQALAISTPSCYQEQQSSLDETIVEDNIPVITGISTQTTTEDSQSFVSIT